MREILFKAKRIDNGEWIIGSLIKTKKDYYICEKPYECMGEYSSLNGQSYGFGGFKFVDPSTICQYTGLTDKNGHKIWENDVVRVGWQDNEAQAEGTHNVTWIKHGYYPWLDEYSCDGCDLFNEIMFIEVIGNIFDNPELLSE